MCHWRRVNNIYRGCGHSVPLPDEMVHCASHKCKFSPNHPIDCLPPTCQRTCWQYRQYPEQYSPQLDRLCPTCNAVYQQRSGTQYHKTSHVKAPVPSRRLFR